MELPAVHRTLLTGLCTELIVPYSGKTNNLTKRLLKHDTPSESHVYKLSHPQII